MSDRKIEEATHDDVIGGSEKIPISDSGVAKYATTGELKDYVLAQIAALTAASSADVSSDGVYLLKDGALKPIGASTLATAILDYGFGKAGVASINGNEVVGVKDSTAQKTITLTSLKAWLEDNLDIDAELDISAKNAATTPLGVGDYLVIEQGSGNRKLTIATFSDWVLNRFAAFVAGLTAAQNLSDTDVVFLVQGENARKCTLAQIKTLIAAGDVSGPASTTENKVPQWDATSKTLKDGLEIASSIASEPTGTKLATEGAVRTAVEERGDVFAEGTTTAGQIPKWGQTSKKLNGGYGVVTSVGATGADTNIPTEKAVRDAITASGGTGAPSTATTENYVPQWSATDKVLKNGLAVQTTLRPSAQAADTSLATEKAVRTAVDGCVAAPISHSENAIPTWGAANELKAGKSVVTTVGSTGSDDNIPTEKAVRTAIESSSGGSSMAYGSDYSVSTAGQSVTIPDGEMSAVYVTEGITSFTLALPTSSTTKPRDFYLYIANNNSASALTITVSSGDDDIWYSDSNTSLSDFFDTGSEEAVFHCYDFFPPDSTAGTGACLIIKREMSATMSSAS